MNMKIAFSLCLAWLLVNCLRVEQVNAQVSSPAAAGEAVVLPGSSVKAEAAVAETDLIFVGQVVESKSIFPAPPSVGKRSLQVKISRSLKGSLPTQLEIDSYVEFEKHEVHPVVGGTYLFFVDKVASVVHKDHIFLEIEKVLPNTSDNVALVTVATSQ